MKNYDELALVHGDSPLSLGWGHKDRRDLRFKVLSERWNLDGRSILDVGCGFGDLGFSFTKNFDNLQYFGIDASYEITKIAKFKYPFLNIENKLLIDIYNSKEKYDYVFASGIFNDKRRRHMHKIKREIFLMSKICKMGLGFNFLTDKNDFNAKGVQYTNVNRVLDYCYKLSKNIVLRNDYMPFEATVFIDFGTELDETLTVYK